MAQPRHVFALPRASGHLDVGAEATLDVVRAADVLVAELAELTDLSSGLSRTSRNHDIVFLGAGSCANEVALVRELQRRGCKISSAAFLDIAFTTRDIERVQELSEELPTPAVLVWTYRDLHAYLRWSRKLHPTHVVVVVGVRCRFDFLLPVHPVYTHISFFRGYNRYKCVRGHAQACRTRTRTRTNADLVPPNVARVPKVPKVPKSTESTEKYRKY